MATLSVLSSNLPQGFKMKVSTPSDNSPPTASISGQSMGGGFSQTFNKITVQNILSENNGNSLNINNNNNANTIVRKIKDFGMFGSVNNATGNGSPANTSSRNNTAPSVSITAKKRPLEESKLNTEHSSTQQVVKKSKASKEIATPKSNKKSAAENVNRPKSSTSGGTPKSGGTPGRKGLPLPQAVARRNARERNRVKQVNNGFAALRDRIPEEVAEAYEVHGSARSAAGKKLSKVETLRMAVEYIRSLERLLGFDFSVGVDSGVSAGSNQGNSGSEDSFTIIKDEFDALSPGDDDDQYEDSLSNYDVDDYFDTSDVNNPISQPNYLDPNSVNQVELLPNITTLNGLQYIRIPGTNTYQLITPDIFVGSSNSPPSSSIDDEHFNALIDSNCLSPAASSATTADLHSSPPSITATLATTAPATPSTATTATSIRATTTTTTSPADVECVIVRTPALSRSPVPRTSSPSASSSLHQQHQQVELRLQPRLATISPAANEVLFRTCATDRFSEERSFAVPTPPQQHLQPRLIKQEFNETEFISITTTTSPTLTSTLSYQATASGQRHLLPFGHATLSASPSSDRYSSTMVPTSTPTLPSTGLQAFYEHDQDASFYEGVGNFKKDLSEVLLDTSNGANGLSDESMIDAIDWWEAHNSKSDGDSVVL